MLTCRIHRIVLAATLALCGPGIVGCDRAGDGQTRVPSARRGSSLTFGEVSASLRRVEIEQRLEIDGRARIRGYPRSISFVIFNEKRTHFGVKGADTVVVAVESDKTISSVPKAQIYEVDEGPTWGAELQSVNGETLINGERLADSGDPTHALRALDTLRSWKRAVDSGTSVAGRTVAFGETIRATDESGTVEMRLVDVVEFRGSQHAVFETKGSTADVSADHLGLGRLEADFAGETLVEVASGRVSRMKAAGPIKYSIRTDGDLGKVRGTIEIDYVMRYDG